ncbi:MAG: cation diffusion facilitator family transporter [Gammaproteobacteria bacterium]|nr:cation diffusion facilitator family transporter [Gammaproteobacteria bacterium]
MGRAFCLVAGFAFIEAVGGYLSNSLTLLADAGHMFLDASALILSWYALRLARRENDHRLSYGYHRFQVLAAFVNALALFVLVAWIAVEAIGRLRAPEPMLPVSALTIASIGLLVNIVALRMLHGTDNLNVRSAALHVLGDLLGSVAAIGAALAVLLFGFLYADPILALAIVVILAKGAWGILRESGHILLEGVPGDIDLQEIRDALTADVTDVREIHHLHAWALTSEKPLLTLHASVEDTQEVDDHDVVTRIKNVLIDRFGIDHSTIQVERGPCPDDERGIGS